MDARDSAGMTPESDPISSGHAPVRADREQQALARCKRGSEEALTKIMKRSVPFLCIDKRLKLCIKLPTRRLAGKCFV